MYRLINRGGKYKMDLNNRNFRPNQQMGSINGGSLSAPQPTNSQPGHSKKGGKLNPFKARGVLNVVYIFLLFSVTIVLVGLLLALVFFKDTNREEGFVDSSKYQAVFLNNGQVYFGHINELNKDYLSISHIFYLRVNQEVQPDRQNKANDVTLAKLGCELHRPQDFMVINRDQITFWENLKDETAENTVPGAIKKYEKNPQTNCEQQQQQTVPEADKTKDSSSTKPSTNNNASEPASTNETNETNNTNDNTETNTTNP